MKIVHLNTLDTGGAAIAVHRIHQCLRTAGVDSEMLVLHKTLDDPGVRSISNPAEGNLSLQKLFHRWHTLLRSYPGRPKGLELFSDSSSAVSLSAVRHIREADILHLHWVAGLLNYSDLAAVANGKPIVWTLHDMNPFTGGCHYAGTCLKFTRQCGACPQLGSGDKNDLAGATWQVKADAFAGLDLNLAAPSRWLGGCITQSRLMGRYPLRIIPNSLPLDQFRPHPRTSIRQRYNIPEKAQIVLFGADDTSNPRKGVRYLWNAFSRLDSEKYTRENLYLLVFGDFFKASRQTSPFTLVSTGRIKDPQTLAQLYATADVFVLPSLEDNLPNTALEALACGTPVVGFASGGIPDIVDHKQTGYLAAKGDPQQLAEGMDWILTATRKGRAFTRKCRQKAEETFAPHCQSQAYLRLYNELLEKSPGGKKKSAVTGSGWPKISVITPSYNQAEYLETCIRSVVEQDYPNIEYIIMDGGSQDGSGEIIKRFEHHLAYWRSRPDAGQYAAIQEGFSRGTGEIMTWINADDVLHPGALKKAAAIFMQRKDIEWITGRPNGIDEKGQPNWRLPILPLWSRTRYLEKNYKTPYIQQEGTFWRRSLWQKAGARMDTDLHLAGDLDLWTRFFRHARLYSVDCLLGAFRGHRRQKTAENLAAYNAEAEIILDKEIAHHSRDDKEPTAAAPAPLTREQVASYLAAAPRDKRKKQPPAGRAPLVSAIVSTYNAEHLIAGCLEDLLAQTISDQLEIIVIDSGSCQDEGRIVRDYQRRFNQITYYRTPQRESVYAAWNRGINAARGKYLTNANTDDRHRPDAFSRMVDALEKNPEIALVYADVIKTETANQTFYACAPSGALHWPQWSRSHLLKRGCYIGPQPMWRRSVHRYFGNFDETYTVSADYEFWLRISQVFDFKKLSMPLGLYHERADSVEHTDADRKKAEDQAIHLLYSKAERRKRIIGFKPYEKLQDALAKRDGKQAGEALAEIEQVAGVKKGNIKRKILEECHAMQALMKNNPARAPSQVETFIMNVSAGFLSPDQPSTSHTAEQVKTVPDHKMEHTLEHKMVHVQSSPQGDLRMDMEKKIRQSIQMLLDNGHQEAALWILDKLLVQFPYEAAAHHDRAQLAHAQGDMQLAEKHFQRAVELDGGNAAYRKSLADFCHVVLENKDAAVEHYLKVVELMPEDTTSLLILSHLFVSMHRFNEARLYYQRLLIIEPEHAEAKQCMERLNAICAEPDPDPDLDLARQHAQQGNRGQAIHVLRQVLAREPDNAAAHNDLGALLYEEGEMNQCLACYQRATQLAPEEPVYQKNLADFYACEKGDLQKALKTYVQVLTLEPQDCEALWAIGQICLGLEKKEDALVFVNRILEIEPWHQQAQALLEELTSAMAKAPLYTPADRQGLHDAARERVKRNDLQGAAETLKQAIAQDPDNAMAYNDLGVLHYDLGEKSKALRCYEQAVRLDHDNLVFMKNLADFYYVEQGRTEEALSLYISILEKDKEDIDSLVAAGTICADLDKHQDARVFFERVLEIEPWHQQSSQALRELDITESMASGDAVHRVASIH